MTSSSTGFQKKLNLEQAHSTSVSGHSLLERRGSTASSGIAPTSPLTGGGSQRQATTTTGSTSAIGSMMMPGGSGGSGVRGSSAGSPLSWTGGAPVNVPLEHVVQYEPFEAMLRSQLSTDSILVVELFSSWVGTCSAIRPSYQKLHSEYLETGGLTGAGGGGGGRSQLATPAASFLIHQTSSTNRGGGPSDNSSLASGGTGNPTGDASAGSAGTQQQLAGGEEWSSGRSTGGNRNGGGGGGGGITRVTSNIASTEDGRLMDLGSSSFRPAKSTATATTTGTSTIGTSGLTADGSQPQFTDAMPRPSVTSVTSLDSSTEDHQLEPGASFGGTRSSTESEQQQQSQSQQIADGGGGGTVHQAAFGDFEMTVTGLGGIGAGGEEGDGRVSPVSRRPQLGRAPAADEATSYHHQRTASGGGSTSGQQQPLELELVPLRVCCADPERILRSYEERKKKELLERQRQQKEEEEESQRLVQQQHPLQQRRGSEKKSFFDLLKRRDSTGSKKTLLAAGSGGGTQGGTDEGETTGTDDEHDAALKTFKERKGRKGLVRFAAECFLQAGKRKKEGLSAGVRSGAAGSAHLLDFELMVQKMLGPWCMTVQPVFLIIRKAQLVAIVEGPEAPQLEAAVRFHRQSYILQHQEQQPGGAPSSASTGLGVGGMVSKASSTSSTAGGGGGGVSSSAAGRGIQMTQKETSYYAFVIQTAWRRIKQLHRIGTYIDGKFFTHAEMAERKLREEQQREHEAMVKYMNDCAVKIQSQWRGYVIRTDFQSKKPMLLQKAKMSLARLRGRGPGGGGRTSLYSTPKLPVPVEKKYKILIKREKILRVLRAQEKRERESIAAAPGGGGLASVVAMARAAASGSQQQQQQSTPPPPPPEELTSEEEAFVRRKVRFKQQRQRSKSPQAQSLPTPVVPTPGGGGRRSTTPQQHPTSMQQHQQRTATPSSSIMSSSSARVPPSGAAGAGGSRHGASSQPLTPTPPRRPQSARTRKP